MYYGPVSQIDHNIGRVLDELDRHGLSENTLVIYTADHGEMMSEHGAWTRAAPVTNATVRVPLIVRPAGGGSRGSSTPGNWCARSTCCRLFSIWPACPSPKTSSAAAWRRCWGTGQCQVARGRLLGRSPIGRYRPCLMARTEQCYKYVLSVMAARPFMRKLFDLAAEFRGDEEDEVANPYKRSVPCRLPSKNCGLGKSHARRSAPASHPARQAAPPAAAPPAGRSRGFVWRWIGPTPMHAGRRQTGFQMGKDSSDCLPIGFFCQTAND
jgi:hypothetical protein